MIERFSNNAEGTLASNISDQATTITLNGAAPFFAGGGEFQRATLSEAGVFEIVYITDINVSGLTSSLTVLRGQEDTTAVAWAAGTTISARVTAGMLDGFLGMDENGIVRTLPNRPQGAFVVNGRTNGAGQVQLSGYHVLPIITAKPTLSAGTLMQQDANMTRESVGGSMIVDLGNSVPTWTANTNYGPNSIVKPATPNGFTYLFESADGNGASQTPTQPAFAPNSLCAALNGTTVVGQWVPIPDPLAFDLILGGQNLVVTEVGFICITDSATTRPTVSIGTDVSATRFANGVVLSQIAGSGHVHRIPVTTGGALANRLKFAVTTPATGRFIGRFYWRGFFAQID